MDAILIGEYFFCLAFANENNNFKIVNITQRNTDYKIVQYHILS